jgi:hypothetical protein
MPHNLPRIALLPLVAFLALAPNACYRSVVTSGQQPPAASPAAAPSAVQPWDVDGPERDSLASIVLRSIAGRETQPAESVFRNIQMPGLRGMQAAALVRAMNLGYSRSLGVSCTHCHVTNDWASDARPAKTAARAMIRMTSQLAPQIRALEGISPGASVTCTTCHRGSVRPATTLPPPPPRQPGAPPTL